MSTATQNFYPKQLFLGQKIQPRHLDRLAIVYVRQSTLQQVEKNSESTKLQYGLVNRAQQLGWTQEKTLVIDEDLGRSGATIEGRTGFKRLVGEVGLDHVGIILGIEISRLARSCRDWYQLLEICSLFETLIGDADGIYDPTNYNDRLLLGLKGTMSEAELHLIKQRMLEGKRAKARRGELIIQLPLGYVQHPSGTIQKDPDEQAQAIIQLIFELFDRFATVRSVQRYMFKNNMQIPFRQKSGLNKGELVWRHPTRHALYWLLHHPMYAGAYVYGNRKPRNSTKKKLGQSSSSVRTVVTPEKWEVLLKDHLPAYISWEQYERNLRQLKANTAGNKGVIRKGVSLLSGLLTCGRCGLRMVTHYAGNNKNLQYICRGRRMDYGELTCQSIVGNCLENYISEIVLESLKPSALEVSLKAAEDLETERAQLHTHWKQRLERLKYEVERASRQYNAVEPENRLVARSLERQWEEALEKEQTLKHEYDRFLLEQPSLLLEEEREAIRKLAEDIPALWKSPTTTPADKKAIIRYLIDNIVLLIQGNTEKVDLKIHWAGGYCSEASLVRPVWKAELLSNYDMLRDRLLELNAEGKAPTAIARILNSEGWRSSKRKGDFSAVIVNSMLSGLPQAKGYRRGWCIERKPDEWTVHELAKKLAISRVTLYLWLRAGKLTARNIETESKRKAWLIHADAKEIERLKSLKDTNRLKQCSKEWVGLVRVN